MICIILILVKPVCEPSFPLDGGGVILKESMESMPLRIGTLGQCFFFNWSPIFILSLLFYYQMEVDCRSVQTPFINPDVTVTRELNLLTVSNRRGLLVSCEPSLSMCSVTLNGWLHGKTSALFSAPVYY